MPSKYFELQKTVHARRRARALVFWCSDLEASRIERKSGSKETESKLEASWQEA